MPTKLLTLPFFCQRNTFFLNLQTLYYFCMSVTFFFLRICYKENLSVYLAKKKCFLHVFGASNKMYRLQSLIALHRTNTSLLDRKGLFYFGLN